VNLGTLKTHIINRTGNDAISSVLTEYVNQVIYDISERHPFNWRMSLPVSLTTIPNQAYLNPSAYLPNFGDPLDALELSTPRKLVYKPIWDINLGDPYWQNAGRKGVPTHYNVDIENQRLWLYPIPDGVYTLSVRYLKLPSEVSNASSSLFIPAQYHHVVASGVESLVWQLDEDLQSASAANQRYEAGIQRMIDKDNMTSDFQPIMTSTSGIVDYSDPFLEV
jgi:hypothetical protein